MRSAACLFCLSVLVAPILAQRADAHDAVHTASVANVPLAAKGNAHDPRPSPASPPSPVGAIAVPEPSTLFLVGTGLVGFALTSRYRRRTGK